MTERCRPLFGAVLLEVAGSGAHGTGNDPHPDVGAWARVIGKVDDVSGLDLEVEVDGRPLAGAIPAMPKTKVLLRSLTMLSAQSRSSAFTSAARPAAMAIVRIAR